MVMTIMKLNLQDSKVYCDHRNNLKKEEYLMSKIKLSFAVVFIVLATMLMQNTVFAQFISELGLERDSDGYYLVNTYQELKEAINSYGSKRIRLNADIINANDTINNNYLDNVGDTVLDLNGKKLVRSGIYVDSGLFYCQRGTLTIEDSSGDNSGTCEFTAYYNDFIGVAYLTNNGRLTVNGGTFKINGNPNSGAQEKAVLYVGSAANAVINGGVFDATDTVDGVCVFMHSYNDEYGLPNVEINGGTFRSDSHCLYISQLGKYNGLTPIILVNNGDFYSKQDHFSYVSNDWGMVAVFGGKIPYGNLNASQRTFAPDIRITTVTEGSMKYYQVKQPTYITSADLTVNYRTEFAAAVLAFPKMKTYLQSNMTEEEYAEIEKTYTSPQELRVNEDTAFGISNLSSRNDTVTWYLSDDNENWSVAGRDTSYTFTCPDEVCTKYLKAVTNIPDENYTCTDVIKLDVKPKPVILQQPANNATVFYVAAKNTDTYQWFIKDLNGNTITWESAKEKGWGYPVDGSENTSVLYLTSIGHNLEGKQIFCRLTGNGCIVDSDTVTIGKFKELGTHLNIYDLQLPFPGVEFSTAGAYTDSTGYELESLKLVYGKELTEVTDKYVDFDSENSYYYHAVFKPINGWCFTEDSIGSQYNINGYIVNTDKQYKYTGTINRKLVDGKVSVLLVPALDTSLYRNTKNMKVTATQNSVVVRNYYEKSIAQQAALDVLGAPTYQYSLDGQNWYSFPEINGGGGPFGGLAQNTGYTLYFKNADTGYIFKTMTVKTLSVPGDVDENGKVEKADAALLLKYIANENTSALTVSQKNVADAYEDGNIDMLDVIAVLNKVTA